MRCCFDLGQVFVGQTCCSDDMHGARLRGQARKCDGCGGCREIDDCLRLGECFEWVVGDKHAVRGTAHGDTSVLTYPIMSQTFKNASKVTCVRGLHV